MLLLLTINNYYIDHSVQKVRAQYKYADQESRWVNKKRDSLIKQKHNSTQNAQRQVKKTILWQN